MNNYYGTNTVNNFNLFNFDPSSLGDIKVIVGLVLLTINLSLLLILKLRKRVV